MLSNIHARVPQLLGILTLNILELFKLNAAAIWLHITAQILTTIILQINEVLRINLGNIHVNVINEVRLQLYDAIALFYNSNEPGTQVPNKIQNSPRDQDPLLLLKKNNYIMSWGKSKDARAKTKHKGGIWMFCAHVLDFYFIPKMKFLGTWSPKKCTIFVGIFCSFWEEMESLIIIHYCSHKKGRHKQLPTRWQT